MTPSLSHFCLGSPTGNGTERSIAIVGAEMNAKQTVYLFSSNVRPLYEQDVLNVLGAPVGLHYRFRYGRKRISDDLATAWGDAIVGRTCVIHFSLQQPNEYQDAVFFPLRLGTVVSVEREAGDIHLLEFALGRAIGLREPQAVPLGPSEAPVTAYVAEVKAYRRFLEEQRVPFP